MKKKRHQHTVEEMLDNLRLVAKEIGHTPTAKEYNTHPLHIVSSRTICVRIGGGRWPVACKVADLTPSLVQITHTTRKLSEEEQEHIRARLLQELYEMKIIYPDKPTTTLITQYTPASSSSYKHYFKSVKMLNQQLKLKYGIDSRKYTYHQVNWNKQIVAEEFKRIEKLLGHPPIQSDMIKYSIYKNIGRGITKAYGTFANLKAAMGYVPKDHFLTEEHKKRKRHILIAALKRIGQKYDTEKWTLDKFVKECHTNITMIRKVFKNVKTWFIKAKVPIPKTIVIREQTKKLTNTKMIKAIKQAALYYGHTPSVDEYDNFVKEIPYSKHITYRFGTWNKALAASGLKINKMNKKPSHKSMIESICEAYKHFTCIPSMRKYDTFKSKICSASTIMRSFGSWNNALKAAGLK